MNLLSGKCVELKGALSRDYQVDDRSGTGLMKRQGLCISTQRGQGLKRQHSGKNCYRAEDALGMEQYNSFPSHSFPNQMWF